VGWSVPLVVGGITNAALRAAGWPPAPGPFLWPLAAVAIAALGVRYMQLFIDRRLRTATDEIEARREPRPPRGPEQRGGGRGQRGGPAHADHHPLLSAGGAPLPPSRLAAWKQALAEASAGQASYLGVAVSRWQRRRNSMSPDLAADVELHCLDGAGTLLLSPAQADELDRILDGLTLCGDEAISRARPRARRARAGPRRGAAGA